MTKLPKTVMPPLPDDSVLKEFILGKLQKYTSIQSLSGQEANFLKVVQEDFDEEYKGNWRKVFLDNNPYYYFRESTIGGHFKKDAPIRNHFLITHTDRVPIWRNKNVTTITSEDQQLQGQLDNIIGIAVARTLIHIGLPVKILFTTDEERVKSVSQVLEVCSLSKYIPITVDIDVFNDLSEFENGLITLRCKDESGLMLLPLVDKLQSLAVSLDIPFTEDKGYAIVETGFLARATNNKYLGAHVGIPLINYHSDEEITTWKVVYNTIKVLYNFFITNHSQII